MNTLADHLRHADPLRREPHLSVEQRDALRRAVVAAGSNVPAITTTRFHLRMTVVAIALLAVAVFVGVRFWSQGSATLQAAVRFEVRLAEDQPAAGLQDAKVSGSDRTVYLHPEIVVGNSDIARSHVVQDTGTSHFEIAVEFNSAGAEKMQRATAVHIGRPVAILIDGDVVSAPVLRSPIRESAMITGDYSREAAERIVNGMTGQ